MEKKYVVSQILSQGQYLCIGLIIVFSIYNSFAQDTLQITYVDNNSNCNVSIFDEKQFNIECPDSTHTTGTFVDTGKYCIVRKDYLDSLRNNSKLEVDTVSNIPKEIPLNIDPQSGFTLLNQNAFIRNKYPVGIVNTEGYYNTICATITQRTTIWLEYGSPKVIRSARIGFKQQVYLTKEKDFAVAILGAFTHLNKADYYESPRKQFEIDGQALLSKQFLKRGNFHFGLLYMFAKGYETDYLYVDGTNHYRYSALYYNNYGFMTSIDYQISRNVKLLFDYSDQFRFFSRVFLTMYSDYYMCTGFRFIMRNVTLDIAALQNEKFEKFPIRPLVRISCFLGNFK